MSQPVDQRRNANARRIERMRSKGPIVAAEPIDPYEGIDESRLVRDATGDVVKVL